METLLEKRTLKQQDQGLQSNFDWVKAIQDYIKKINDEKNNNTFNKKTLSQFSITDNTEWDNLMLAVKKGYINGDTKIQSNEGQ